CLSLLAYPNQTFASINKDIISFQEEIEIKGKIVDKNGTPIAGVSITIKGKSVSTSTDANGNFTFRVPRNSVLVLTSMGYSPIEHLVLNSNPINLTMTESNEELDEVVVIGYGTQSRKETTGSLTSVKGDDVGNLPVQSFDAALAGRSSGVQVNTSSGVLNQAPVFKIRGTNSLSLSTYPLVVIDGVPAFNDNDDSGPSYAASNPLSAINPADIESIDIAKDAAATSIYGSRAAKGAVFITTKKGRKGAAKVTYQNWVGFTNANNLLDVVNAGQSINIHTDGLLNEGTFDPVSSYYGYSLDNQGRPIDTDWSDHVYRSGVSHSHNLNISGASESTNYYASVGYTDQEGIFKATTFDRKTILFNV